MVGDARDMYASMKVCPARPDPSERFSGVWMICARAYSLASGRICSEVEARSHLHIFAERAGQRFLWQRLQSHARACST